MSIGGEGWSVERDRLVASARPVCNRKVAGTTSVHDSSRNDPGQVVIYDQAA